MLSGICIWYLLSVSVMCLYLLSGICNVSVSVICYPLSVIWYLYLYLYLNVSVSNCTSLPRMLHIFRLMYGFETNRQL